MRIGVCHSPPFIRSVGRVFRDTDLALLKPFDFFVPRGYLCAPMLLECRDLILAEISKVTMPIRGHSLVPFRKNHTPRSWGGQAYGKSPFTYLSTAKVRSLKIEHLRQTILDFPQIDSWVLGLEIFRGDGVAVAPYLNDYFTAADRLRPDKTYTISEVLGTSRLRWERIFEQLTYLDRPPDRVGIQFHVRLDCDFDFNGRYRYLDLLKQVAEISPFPLCVSEVCLWYAESGSPPTDAAISLLESIIEVTDWESVCWWHWTRTPLWPQPGRPYGVAVIDRNTSGEHEYTEFGRYLMGLNLVE